MPDQPPTELVSEDLEPGDGAEAKLGDTIKVHYVGIACSTGMQFDSSWDSGQPADLQLAEGGLIKGWTEGIPGMKVGGRRKLVVPGDLAYGAEGRPGIAPNETLVFVIDLVDVTPAGEADPGTTTTVASGEEDGSGGEDPATTTTTAP
jgi:peptidylprolyl isomerase